MSEFRDGLAEILDVDVSELSREMRLEEAGWDSMAVVSTIALLDELYDRTVSAEALSECATVGDLEDLAERQRSESVGN